MSALRRTRRGGSSSGVEVSLFPFLAVLLCTMGMLVMILVLIGRNTSKESPSVSSVVQKRTENRQSAPEPTVDSVRPDPYSLAESPAPKKEPIPTEVEPEHSPEDRAEENSYAEQWQKFGGATIDEIETELENADWFLSELQKVRERTAQKIADQRARLSEAETEVAKQVEDLVRLNAEALALRKTKDEKSEGEESKPTPDVLKAEIEKKATEIAELSARVDELRRKANETQAQKSYAIIPYKGKSGTFRRPIYIECGAEGIYLMPESVRFAPEDFLLAKYPGNPFDAAIRAARQYYIETGQGTEENEPYPLLIIRPEAASQYYAAKAALASWGGDYGYEFVESDWNIEYPKPDAELNRRILEQLTLARTRLAAPLAMILAEMEQKGEMGAFRQSNGGGSGSSDGAGNQIANRLGPYAKLTPVGESTGLSGGLPGNLAGGTGGAAFPGTISGATGSLPGGSGEMGGNVGNRGSEAGTMVAASGASSGPRTNEPVPEYQGQFQNRTVSPSGNSTVSSPATDGYQQAATDGYQQAASEARYAEKTETNGQFTGQTAGNASTGLLSPEAGQASAVTDQASATALQAAFQNSTNAGASSESASGIVANQTLGNTTYQSNNSGQATNSNDASPDSVMISDAKTPPDEKTKKPKVVAEKTPGAINLTEEFRKPSQMAIERPIIVECLADRIRFVPQPGIPGGREIAFGTNAGAEQEVLETIIYCVKSWNVAGRNMFWSPWIKANVAADAETTFAQFRQWMETQQVRTDRAGGSGGK